MTETEWPAAPVRSALAVVSLAALLLAGCAGPQDFPYDVKLLDTSTAGLSPQAAALVEEARRHAKIRVSDAAIGGVAGMMASVIPSQGKSGGAGGALTGAAGGAGAVIGYACGEYIDARNTRLTMDKEKLDLLVTAARHDASAYRQDRINAQAAIAESRAAVARLNQEYQQGLHPAGVYRQQAETLTDVSYALQALIRELQANTAIMSQDILEAEDNQAIGDTELRPELLLDQRLSLQNEHDELVSSHEVLRAVAFAIPRDERPLIDATPHE